MRSQLFVVLVAAHLTVPGLSAADQGDAGEGVKDLPLTALEGESAPIGQRVKVRGKYRELLDKELRLFGSKVHFLIGSSDLRRRALQFTARRDNLVVVGRLQGEGGATEVVVESLNLGASDVEELTGRLEGLEETGKGGEAECLAALADLAERYELEASAALLPIGGRFFRLALGKADSSLSAERAQLLLGALQNLHARVRAPDLTVELANLLLERAPAKSAIEDWLREIGCRRLEGKWLSYGGFKQAEGFVFRDGAWIPPREKSFLDRLERFREQKVAEGIHRRRTDREYQILADRGNTEEGMKPEEVTIAIGYPDRVERKSLAGKEVDQWVYGEKYYYFIGGVLVDRS